MKVVRETCVAGMTIDRTIKVTSGNHGTSRGIRKNITSEMVQKNNDRLAAKNLARLLNNNFGHGDLHIVLTYKDAPDVAQAKKNRDAFIKALRRENIKKQTELKYVAVTEYKHARIHHHLVINSTEVAILKRIWKKGWVRVSMLDDSGNYTKLAEYLIKETTLTFREAGSLQHRRYSCSSNLIRPVVKREWVDASELSEDPVPIKGYYIPKECERRYVHPVTGLEHLEYIMVAINAPRKYKQWPRGKKTSGREYWKANHFEEQQRIC